MFTTCAFADSIGENIDGQQIKFADSTGYAFVNENGRTMVPLRVTMEAFKWKNIFTNKSIIRMFWSNS